MSIIKTYRTLIRFPTFEERFNYLKLNGSVGFPTFSFERYLNQSFYHSREWRHIRQEVIIRDNGCDLAVQDREIFGKVVIHHLNSITIQDIENGENSIYDLNNLICTCHDTHNAIHYGDVSLLSKLPIERKKGDTCPWIAY